jgi:hypothetical protein
MKKILLLFAFHTMALQVSAQYFEWAKREGLWAYDYGYGVATDNSGNIYVAGKYEMNANFSGVILPCEGNHDIFVAKYTPSGSLSWIRTAGGYTGDYATCVACDGNYVYMGGETEGDNALIKFPGSPITLTCKGSNDIVLAKYDLNGNLLWARGAGGNSYEKALGISYDAAGNIYICGVFDSYATFGGSTTIYSAGNNDIFVAKYDANGNFLWVRKGGGSGRDDAKSIKCDAAGNSYICGMYKGTANFSGQVVTTPDGYWNMYVAKYDTHGNLIWIRTAGGNWDDLAWSLTMDNSGKIFVAGEFNSNINFGGISLNTSGQADVFVACYNSSGNVLWAKKAGGPGIDRARGIGTDGNNVFITGQFGSWATFGGTTLNAADNSDIFNARLDNNGNFIWANSVGGRADDPEDLGYESGNAITADQSGNVYSTGGMLNGGVFGNITLGAYTRTDLFLSKINNSGAGPSCQTPSGLYSESVTNSSAVLRWNAVANASSYDVQYRKTGSGSWTTVNASTNSKSISGLQAASTYEFQVKSICSSGSSNYSGSHTFNTTGGGGGGGSNDLITAGASWKYLDNGSNQGTQWRSTSFNDLSWKTGNAELGYGDGDEVTVVSYGPSASNKYVTTYFRKSFNVNDKSAISALELSVIRDDGIVVYINGTEVYRNNMPGGTISYNTFASSNISGAAGSTYQISNISSAALLNGNNVIAVEIHQISPTSSDISFNLKLKALTSSPPPPSSVLIAAGSSWKYLDNGSNQGSSWTAPSFNDGSWKSGNAELGYGDGGEATVVSYGPSPTNKYITTYFRKSFNLADKTGITALELSLIRDDGAVVYLNGTEIFRSNLPSGPIYYNTLAPTYIDGANESTFVVNNVSASALLNGNNVIAVEIHQNSVASSDISFNLQLKTLSGARPVSDSVVVQNLSGKHSAAYENYDMIIYPNPNTGRFNLELCADDLAEKTMEAEVIDARGLTVLRKNAAPVNGCIRELLELDATLPEGVYILKIKINEHTQVSKMYLTKSFLQE